VAIGAIFAETTASVSAAGPWPVLSFFARYRPEMRHEWLDFSKAILIPFTPSPRRFGLGEGTFPPESG
jgi:hypothetical protein